MEKKNKKQKRRSNQRDEKREVRRRVVATTRRYHRVGRFDAKGPAAIIKLEEEDMVGIDWANLRLFFRPNEPSFHALRVKPSKTTIYGPEMHVFAVPPAPAQWLRETNKKRQQTKSSGDMCVDIEVFVEDLPRKTFQPYGSVVYVFSESTPQAQAPQAPAAQVTQPGTLSLQEQAAADQLIVAVGVCCMYQKSISVAQHCVLAAAWLASSPKSPL